MESSWVRMRLVDGDGQLAARAGGEVGHRLTELFEPVGTLDRHPQASGEDVRRQPVERGRFGIGHDRGGAHVPPHELVGTDVEGGGEPAAGHQQVGKLGGHRRRGGSPHRRHRGG